MQSLLGNLCYRNLCGPTSGLPCQRVNHWIPLLRAYWGLPRAYLANKQIIGYHCFGLTRGYLGPTLPTSKSLDTIASGLLGPTSGLPCQRANHWISWLRAHSGLPRAYIANEQSIGYNCFGLTRAYLGPTFANQPILLKQMKPAKSSRQSGEGFPPLTLPTASAQPGLEGGFKEAAAALKQ